MSGNDIQALDAQHRKPFLRWVKRRFGISEADAQDVYQESVTAFAQRETQNEGGELECQPSTFLYAIGRNQTLKLIRSRKGNENSTIELDSAGGLFELPEVESLFDMEHARTVVREGLARLTERQREVLRLYYYEERSMQEIATVMGYNNADVAKKMKYEGLKKLSTLIVRSCAILFFFHAF